MCFAFPQGLSVGFGFMFSFVALCCNPSVQLVSHLERELSGLEAQRDTFVKEHGQPAYDRCVDSWQGKLRRARAGVQRWLLILAHTPQGGVVAA
jgi:hypothetical protein